METHAICPECDKDIFHVLILDPEEFVHFECIECGHIIKPDSPDERLQEFTTLVPCKTS